MENDQCCDQQQQPRLRLMTPFLPTPLHGGSVRIIIQPNGDDTWRFNFNTRINFTDGGSLSVGRVGVQMSEEHEAYSWPIP